MRERGIIFGVAQVPERAREGIRGLRRQDLDVPGIRRLVMAHVRMYARRLQQGFNNKPIKELNP